MNCDENWNDNLVAVTGADGFIGSHLTELLLKKGFRVNALVRYTGKKTLSHLQGCLDNPGLKLYYGDIRDSEVVKQVSKSANTIFHLAAIISIPYSIESPQEAFSVNCGGTLNVLEAARQGNTKVILTSTSEVYGTAQQIPMTENHPRNPRSPYAASKIAADMAGEAYYRSYNLPVTILRPFNTFGPRQSDRAIIPTIISQALWADEIHVGSLEPKRDFTFVADTAEAFLLAMQNNVSGQTIHLGTGEFHSVSKIIDLVQNILGTRKNVISDDERVRKNKSEVMALISNPEKANRLLGWKSKVSFEEGLEETIHWMANNKNQFKLAYSI